MKTLLVGEFGYGTLGLSYFNALKKLGCDIFQFDLMEEYKTLNPLVRNKYAARVLGNLLYKKVNERLLDIVSLYKPEIVFIIKGALIFPDTLRKIKEKINPLILNFNPDNPFNINRGASNNLIRKSIPIYDCYFTWGKFLIPELKKVGAKQVEYLPFAYDQKLHYPLTISEEEKNIYGSDVAFIGSWDKEREEWLQNLSDYDLAIWGNAWGKLKHGSQLKKKWKGREVVGEDFSKVCNASKIVLNLIRKQNGNAHNMRTFEVPACQGFMLTTRTEEQCRLFTEDREIACFGTPEELKMKIDYYLSQDELRSNISSNAYKKVKAHTYFERAKQILEFFEVYKT